MTPEDILQEAAALAEAEARLANAERQVDELVDPLRRVLSDAEAVVAKMKAVIAGLRAPGAAERQRIDAALAALAQQMGDINELCSGGVRVWVVSSGGKQPIEYDGVVEKDAPSLPEAFHARKIMADKEAIRAALERGENLPFARLLPRGRTVRIERVGILPESREA